MTLRMLKKIAFSSRQPAHKGRHTLLYDDSMILFRLSLIIFGLLGLECSVYFTLLPSRPLASGSRVSLQQ